MRSSALTGLGILLLASQAIIGCDDSEDRKPAKESHSGGSSSDSAGAPAGGEEDTGGTFATAGTNSGGANGGKGGTFGSAGTGGSVGGGGTAGTAGTAGTGGTVAVPSCTTDAQCADTNGCTDDACTDGACVHTNNTATCDDGNACTSGDVCAAGACVGTNNTATCDDLSACTTGDACVAGVCRGNKDRVACPSCDDALNLVQNCDFTEDLNHWEETFLFGGGGTQQVINQRLVLDITSGGVNVYDVQPRQEQLHLLHGMKYKLRMVVGASVDRNIVVALTQAVAPYTVHSTGDNAAGGFTLALTKQAKLFEHEFFMTDADDTDAKLELKIGGADGNPSTVYFDDMYVAPEACTNSAGCDDGNACTDDVCDPVAGLCSWTNNTGACTDDGNECTDDVCAAGTCTHPGLPDDTACTADADNCTADVCTAGACTHAFDTNVCNCQQNSQCDDHNPCTDDTCNASVCEYTPNTASCDDGNVCTVADVCATGTCGAGTNVCYDCTAGGNLLTNCDLSNGATNWLDGFFGGTGTQTVTNGERVVNITSGGTDGYMQSEPRQEGITLRASRTTCVDFASTRGPASRAAIGHAFDHAKRRSVHARTPVSRPLTSLPTCS